MKSLFCRYLLVFLLINVTAVAQTAWKIVPGKIVTDWAATVTPENVHTEYPRPQLQRDQWLNLNGLWDYSIRSANDALPNSFDGKILVPFPIESALSGVGKSVGKDNRLWYRRGFKMPSGFPKGNVLLHFGAVDWVCEVFINGSSVGKHQGGYDAFSFNVTKFVKGGSNEIVVSVWDPSDEGVQPRGKQVRNPNSIWYTPVTGIWQTVWLEGVGETFIRSTRNTPDLDNKKINLNLDIQNQRSGDVIRVTAFENNNKLASTDFSTSSISFPVPFAEEWIPQSPRLYDLELAIVRNGKVVDKVRTYFALRKISMAKDANGIQRMMLNNKVLFQYGPLDQGWWPDGLYTAPNDEALRFDIEKTKAMGFNMIRKHVKVEPARWYYHCDRLGMLVWQDMPSGDMGNRWDSRPAIVGIATDKERTAESEAIFKNEWQSIMNSTYNFPCIVVWVPFNEGWGQFKTPEIVAFTAKLDSSRLINEASGGNYSYTGNIIDLHNYPSACMPDPTLFGAKQILALGEFGGLGLPLEGHTWQVKDNWGYQSFSSNEELLKKYTDLVQSLNKLISQGLSAAVYTQTTDVEIETNGLMTYDRKIIKMPVEKLNQMHSSLYSVPVK